MVETNIVLRLKTEIMLLVPRGMNLLVLTLEEEMWRRMRWVVILLVLWRMEGTSGIRFVIDREECFAQDVKYEGDALHVSFVVIKAESPWHSSNDQGVDLVVRGPSGEQIRDFRDKTSEKFEFNVQNKGIYNFCFTSHSPYHETIDFDAHVAHFSYFDDHARDEHFAPLMEHISKLQEALYNIQFEQHWLEAQTDRQVIVNNNMGRQAIHKAMIESVALIATSLLQIYLLRRLFNRKLGRTIV